MATSEYRNNYYQDNKTRIKAASKKYYDENRELISKKAKMRKSLPADERKKKKDTSPAETKDNQSEYSKAMKELNAQYREKLKKKLIPHTEDIEIRTH